MTGSLIHWLAAVVVRIAFKEYAIHVAGVLLSHIEPFALAGGSPVGHGALVHVTHIIELMAVNHKGVRRIAGTPAHFAHIGGHGEELVDITVGHLGVGYHVDNLVHRLLQFWVVTLLEKICCTLHYLEEVGGNVAGERLELLFLTLLKPSGHAPKILHCRSRFLKCERHKSSFLSH